MEKLQELYERKDFGEVWLRISGDIKIRKYKKLNDLPEINNLPEKVKQHVHSAANNIKFNYEVVRDEGLIYSTAYVVLLDQRDENWIGIFQYNYATTAVKITGLVLGGICIGGILYFFSAAAAQYINSLVGYIAQNYMVLRNAIVQFAGILLTGIAFRAFARWLMNEHSEWNILIAACILKKLQEVRGS